MNNAAPTRNRRRLHYIDQRLQLWLIIGLVAMEATLVLGALWYLSGAFNQIIEAGLYRIHPDPPEVIGQQLLAALGWALLALTVINVVALTLADRLWAAHLKRVLTCFHETVTRVQALDLSPLPEMPQDHELSTHARRWFETERQRCLKIDQTLTALTQSLAGTKTDSDTAKQHLITLHKLVN